MIFKKSYNAQVLRTVLVGLLIILIILTCWTWYENTYRIDFFPTKNQHLRNQKKMEVIEETNMDSLKQEAVRILDNFEQHHDESDETVLRIQKLLTLTACLAFLTLILSVVEFSRKTGR